MNTTQALTAMSPSDFETLVTWFLRRHNPELEGLISTGLNEKGKPVPCRVDNILFVLGNPPKCIAVATTTQEKLREKWLANEGDINKAHQEFKAWNEAFLGISCVLYLATNQPLKSDTLLYREAEKAANTRGIELHLIEQSGLADFLDNTSDGQYLRWHFFNIPLYRLSVSLLKDIGNKSLAHHKEEFALNIRARELEITREAEATILKLLRESATSLIAIQGASGTGKSTLLRHLGETLILDNGAAVWIRADKLNQHVSLVGLLSNLFKEFYPSLNTDAEEIAKVVAQLDLGLTLLIDDINRLDNPEKALTTIQGWANLESSQNTDTSFTKGHFRFVVPLWPSIIKDDQIKAVWRIADLQNYSNQEKESIIAQLNHNERIQDYRRILEILSGDPFLSSLALGRLEPFGDLQPSTLIRATFTDLIKKLSNEAVTGNSQAKITAGELISSLDSFIEMSLTKDEPYPSWRSVLSSLPELSTALWIWAEQKSLGWITESGGTEFWRWKHNRLRDALIGRYLANYIERHPSESNQQLNNWLSNPGLAEAWAMSLVFLKDTELQTNLLKLLSQFQPLALAEILRLGLFPEGEALRVSIGNYLEPIVEAINWSRDHIENPLDRELLLKLTLTDDPLVVKITEKAKPTTLIYAARLRNGIAVSGLHWLKQYGGFDFAPSRGDLLLEQSLAAFQSKVTSRLEIIQQLENHIRKDEYLSPSLTFAGYLAWPDILPFIATYWMELPLEKQLETLTEFIWMVSRCGGEAAQENLEYALSLISHISDVGQNEGKSSERIDKVVQPLEFAFQRWEIPSSSANTWVKCAEMNSSFEAELCYIMRVIDQPITTQFYVEWCAKNGRSFHGDLVDFGPHDTGFFRGPEMAQKRNTREHLWSLITKSKNEEVRKWAFECWRIHATQADCVKLQTILEGDNLFDQALKVRLKLLDNSAVNLLLQKVRANPRLWFAYLSLFVDEREVYTTFLETLEEALEVAFQSESVIQYLPDWAMQDLLTRKSEILSKSPATWYYLWRSDRPVALKFVQKVVSQAKEEDLKYFFGRGGWPFPISLQMLNALNPILKYFPRPLYQLVLAAQNAGYVGWIQEHLLEDILADKNLYRWITIEDISSILDTAVKTWPQGINAVYKIPDFYMLLMPDFRKYGVDYILALRKWLKNNPEPVQIIIASLVLTRIGAGQDIIWWEAYEPEDEFAQSAWIKTINALKRRKWLN